jgi:pyruvate,water dikinase
VDWDDEEAHVHDVDRAAETPAPAAPCGAAVAPLGPATLDAASAGAKAANLARCAAAGLPVVPGFVLTTAGAAAGVNAPDVAGALDASWRRLSDDGTRALVVRSSSTVEDAGESSMAGQFRSVLDVRGYDAFRVAVADVLGSASRPRSPEQQRRPMAVLVQRQVPARIGGVLFGVDPVTGSRRHVVVEVVGGGPDALVSGRTVAAHYVLSRLGRVIDVVNAEAAPVLDRRVRRALVRLAGRCGAVFGSPQDVEWEIDDGGSLWLLQSRPVTAIAASGGRGHLLGPGPVAETFPEPMRTLDAELWLGPLREGIIRALAVTGATSNARLRRSPVATTVGGWPAVDLELLGVVQGHPSPWRRVDPRAIVRRLGTAWRVGRLRVALPELASRLVARVDAELEGVPGLEALSAEDLVELVDRTRDRLATVHTHEMLAGMLLRSEDAPSATLVALGALNRARHEGLDDAETLVRFPVVLALRPPSMGEPVALPTPGSPASTADIDALSARDALRLRARWLQELLARSVRALGTRLADAGAVERSGLVREMTWQEVRTAVLTGVTPAELAARASCAAGPRLPVAFRLTASGAIVPSGAGRDVTAEGVPVGGGRAVGPVWSRVRPGSPPRGVLVVKHLEPELAGVLPHVAAVVSETGSALSHLAILAREMGVPAVVAVPDARRRFPVGAQVLVDGTTGEVRIVGERSEEVA